MIYLIVNGYKKMTM